MSAQVSHELSTQPEGFDRRVAQERWLHSVPDGAQQVELVLPPMKTPTAEAPYQPPEGHEYECPPAKFRDPNHQARSEVFGADQQIVSLNSAAQEFLARLAAQ